MRKLMDSDGENRAVRSFLALYGGNVSTSIGRMREHLELSGFDKHWPDWAAQEDWHTHLTKLVAQNWLRHLFALESGEQPADELTHEQITAGAAVLGDDGKPIGRNTAIMVADAMRIAGQPADERKSMTRCAAARDGDCTHPQCPQLRDGEPGKTGRHCPLDTEESA